MARSKYGLIADSVGTANTELTQTISGVAGEAHVLFGVVGTYSNNGTGTLTVKDGDTTIATYYIDDGNSGVGQCFTEGVAITPGANLVCVLSAGGEAAVGAINTHYKTVGG